jgi:hypothetical protein
MTPDPRYQIVAAAVRGGRLSGREQREPAGGDERPLDRPGVDEYTELALDAFGDGRPPSAGLSSRVWR